MNIFMIASNFPSISAIYLSVFMLVGGWGWMGWAAHRIDTDMGRRVMTVPGYALIFCAGYPREGLPPLLLQFAGMAVFFSSMN